MPNALRPPLNALLEAWAQRVRPNREQVDRVREVEDGADYYSPVAAAFIADPHRQHELALNILRTLMCPEHTWLDIGAGGGRYTLPLALLAREVYCHRPI